MTGRAHSHSRNLKQLVEKTPTCAIIHNVANMNHQLTLTPAYGQEYKSKTEVEQAWQQGKDFQHEGRYINKQDALHAGIKQVRIRYASLRKVHIISVE